MNRRCFAALVIALSTVLVSAQRTEAANGSNYLHLINGLDYFFGKTAPAGKFRGIFRCFPSEMLHSPTLVVEPTNPLAGTYATKIVALHFTVFAAPSKLITFPTVALTSAVGTCGFLTSSGALNFGFLSVSGFGRIMGGPLDGGTGIVNFLGGVQNIQVLWPGHTNAIVQIGLNLTALHGSPSTIAVPEGESLVYWVQDDPNQFFPGLRQYWTGSVDEQFLCSLSHSFMLSTSGTVLSFQPWSEFSIGLGTLDASMTPVITSLGPGISGLNAHDGSLGFSPGFDQGSGTLTISATGFTGGGEFLGFAIYDENNQYGGSSRLAIANLPGTSGTCAGYIPSPWPSGFGGSVLSSIIPQSPRSVGVFDPLTALLLNNAIWVMSTNHNTAPGSMNIPWFPAAADISGSNATGINGGFVIPLPNCTALPGLVVNWWNWPTDPTNNFVDSAASGGHSNTNSYQTLFFP